MDVMRGCTFFVNDTDVNIRIKYNGYVHTLKPKRDSLIVWDISNHRDRFLSQFHLEGVELDRNISNDDVLKHKWIVIFGDASDACYSFRTFQSLSSEDMDQVALLPLWVFETRYTVFENKTDSEIQIEYDGDVHTLNPKSTDVVRWFTYDAHETLLPKMTVKGIELDRNISLNDLYDNFEITIFRGGDNACSFQTLSSRQLKERVVETRSEAKKILLRMEVRLKKVKIWCNQCKLLLDKYRGSVNIVARVLDGWDVVGLASTTLIKFVCSKLLCCMLEGEALLLFCSGNNSYSKAAFALSSPPPPVPTFSRFALVLRELDWTLDLICQVEKYFNVEGNIFDGWEWCEKRCRLVSKVQGNSTVNLGAMEDDSLEADGRDHSDDRKALETFLKSKSTRFWTRNEFREKLEAIWRKRLLPPSHTPGPDSVPDCFWIDNPDFKLVEHLANGAFKFVDKSKWLGVMVAVATVNNISKQQLVAEAGLLARVQHPNVVELLGCAYKEDGLNDPKGFIVTELMEQDLESLIRHQQRRSPGSGSRTTMEVSEPFDLPVAVDMALQIVEAMIHLKECGVIHRDLKPSNCLASAKYQKTSSLSIYGDVPIYYTIKLTDFGTSKMRGHDSYFRTKRLGTASYMAPELHGRPEEDWPYTWSADVYSLGMTYYKIFTGRDPFATNILRDVSAIVCEGKRPLFPSGCWRFLKILIEKCWAQNPADRPTFQDIRKHLWQFKLCASAESLVIGTD